MRIEESTETNDLSVYHEVLDSRANLSSEDLTKAYKSLLSQIDWSKVAIDVVDKGTPITRRVTVQRLLQHQVEAVLLEACQNATPGLRQGKTFQEAADINDSDIHTESGETESDEESYEHSFVETDDSENGSAEYQDSGDSVEAGGKEDDVDDWYDVCAICRKSMSATASHLS